MELGTHPLGTLSRNKKKPVQDVFPAAIGLNLVNLGVFLVVLFDLPAVLRQGVMLAVILVSQLSYLTLVRLVTDMSGNGLYLTISWLTNIGGGFVMLLGVGFMVFDSSTRLLETLFEVSLFLNILYTGGGLLVSSTLADTPDDAPETREAKRFFRSMVWTFPFLFPLFLVDFFWTTQPHPLGYRFSSIALQCLVGGIVLLRSFYRWVFYHVDRTAIPARSALNWDQAQDFGITKREWEIIQYLNRGLANKEVAYELNVQSVTVKNHVFNIDKKTGVKSRVELLNLLRQT